jgi:hypothetical protein
MTENEHRDDVDEPQGPGPVGDGITKEPRGNPEPDQEALEKGRETLERVKPY